MAGCGGALAGLTSRLALLPRLAEAAYPSRAIKLIVPYPAGGTTDLLGRLVAEQFQVGLGATVVVENKPGAAPCLGPNRSRSATRRLHAAAGDLDHAGHQQGALPQSCPTTPCEGFYADRAGGRVPFALIINPSLPVKTLPEFIAYAKSNPGLAYGSAGNGSPHHLGAEMLAGGLGLSVRHVTYRGSVPAMLDVIAGRIAFMVVDLQPALPQIREGKVRVLGVTTGQRVAAAPDIPTLAEAGLVGFELVAWQGVVAPAGLPQPIVEQLAAQIDKADEPIRRPSSD
jgi:tripartite-type tricarboxylate transporter receptor subunit TctC